jgi:hypothetical protein
MGQPSTSAGWYPDPSGAPGQRYFDGLNWTQQYQAMSVRPGLSDTERSDILDRAVMMAVSRGGRVEYRSQFQATIVWGQPVNNVLHVLLMIFTCFLWAIVWLLVAGSGGERRETLSVDPQGSLWASGFVHGSKTFSDPVKLA